MRITAFVRLLSLQYLLVQVALQCWAVSSTETLDFTSRLYTFGPGWTSTNAAQSTSEGSVYISYKGSAFYITGINNAEVTLTTYVDGHKSEIQPNVLFGEGITEGDHQVLIEVRAPQSNPFVFTGITFPISNNTASANVTQAHTPETYGLAASMVPPNAITLDNNHRCVRYSSGDWWHSTTSPETQWGSYNSSLAISTEVRSAMTIYFFGTGIWLFSSQLALHNPTSASVIARVDTEPLVDVSLSSFTAPDVALQQKFWWSSTNLTSTFHSLTLSLTHSNQDQITFDFARVEGSSIDCSLFTTDPTTPYGSTVYPLTWEVMEIIALVCVFIALPTPFFCCFCVFCYRENRKVQRRRMRIVYLPKSREAGEKSDTFSDGSSILSVMTRHVHGNGGTQALPLEYVSDDEDDFPRPAPLSHAIITPFGPVVLGGDRGRYAPVRRDSKGVVVGAAGTRFGVAVRLNGGRAEDGGDSHLGDVWDPISVVVESDTETGSDVSSLAPSLTPTEPGEGRENSLLQLTLNGVPLHIGRGGDDHHHDSRSGRSSPSPPPSYMTEVQDPRHGRTRLLTQDDLGRLVDRVAALRRRGTTRLALVGEGGVTVELQGEDGGGADVDPVEMLARRIAESRHDSGMGNEGPNRDKTL